MNGVRTLVTGSMLNLAELCGMRPDVAAVPCKVLYVHENQLVYPVQAATAKGERDHVFGHALIVSCVAADRVVWNSRFNLESFLDALPRFCKDVPLESAGRPKPGALAEAIRAKSVVLYPPLLLLLPSLAPRGHGAADRPLRIGFPHRWEHDKDPDAFVRVVSALAARALDFSVLVFGGEDFQGTSARSALEAAVGGHRVAHVGRVASRDAYLALLAGCHVCVSSALHEFFGIAMVEAALMGVAVLAPNRLAYPELFNAHCLYADEADLVARLGAMATHGASGRGECLQADVARQLDGADPAVAARVLDVLGLSPSIHAHKPTC